MEPGEPGIHLIDEAPSDPGTGSLLSDESAVELLRTATGVAVVGASTRPWRAAHSVMRYLLDHGYDCVPVTPTHDEVLGRECFDTLEAAVAATGPFDIVDVFRRPVFAPEVARAAVATGCGALWLQQGVISHEAVRIARAGGLAVVMDRCPVVLHRRIGGGGRP